MRTLLLLLTAICTFAGQMAVPNGSGFANTCAGYSVFSSLPNPGDGFNPAPAATHNCSSQTAPFASAVSSYSGVHNGNPFDNSASAQSKPGMIKVDADNNARWSIPFAGASAYAGWNDEITITGGTGSAP